MTSFSHVLQRCHYRLRWPAQALTSHYLERQGVDLSFESPLRHALRSMPVRVDVTNLGTLTRSLQRKPASSLLTADCWPRRRRRGVWATTSVSVEAALLLTTSEARVNRFLAERGDGSARPSPYERHRRSGSPATGGAPAVAHPAENVPVNDLRTGRKGRLFTPSHASITASKNLAGASSLR
jgi:hypothetical protein